MPNEQTELNINPASEVPAPTRSLVRKLAEVMAAVGWIEKSGYNEFHKYKYAQEADLVNALRGELAKRNVMVFPSVTNYTRNPHEVETYKGIRKTQLSEIVTEWTFVDGDSGEERTLRIPGVGEDNVDKGFYKAFTGSEKYMLMKTFLIPTGDDPEQDSKEDREEARKTGKQAAQEVAQRKIAQSGKPASTKIDTLFYTVPENHNGNRVEFINLPQYIQSNLDRENELRFAFSAVGAKKNKDEVVWIAADKLEALLQTLAGELGITVHQLKPSSGAQQ